MPPIEPKLHMFFSSFVLIYELLHLFMGNFVLIFGLCSKHLVCKIFEGVSIFITSYNVMNEHNKQVQAFLMRL